MKTLGVAGGMALVSVLLLGQAAPTNKIVEAQEFILRDTEGRQRAKLYVDDVSLSGPFLVFYDTEPSVKKDGVQSGPEDPNAKSGRKTPKRGKREWTSRPVLEGELERVRIGFSGGMPSGLFTLHGRPETRFSTAASIALSANADPTISIYSARRDDYLEAHSGRLLFSNGSFTATLQGEGGGSLLLRSLEGKELLLEPGK